jgi:hypothetical protein
LSYAIQYDAISSHAQRFAALSDQGLSGGSAGIVMHGISRPIAPEKVFAYPYEGHSFLNFLWGVPFITEPAIKVRNNSQDPMPGMGSEDSVCRTHQSYFATVPFVRTGHKDCSDDRAAFIRRGK